MASEQHNQGQILSTTEGQRLYTQAQLDVAIVAARAEGEWRDIETAPKNRKLIVGYFNPLGKWRSVMGCYYTEGTLESDTDDSGFAPEGWYENTEAYEYLMPMEHETTHWMPLPAPPKGGVSDGK